MTSPSSSRRSLPGEIVRQLQRRILGGELRPGERLPPERELALTLGTNRNTLREALRALEAQGLVRARQGDGVRVLDFRETGELGLLPAFLLAVDGEERLRTFADLLRIRTLAAAEAVSLASRRAGPEDLAALRTAHQRLTLAYRREEPKALAEAELALYRALTGAARSVAARWLFNSLERVLRGLLEVSPDLWVTPESYEADWQAIVSAVERHDEAAARTALQHLLWETDRILLALLGLEAELDPAP